MFAGKIDAEMKINEPVFLLKQIPPNTGLFLSFIVSGSVEIQSVAGRSTSSDIIFFLSIFSISSFKFPKLKISEIKRMLHKSTKLIPKNPLVSPQQNHSSPPSSHFGGEF